VAALLLAGWWGGRLAVGGDCVNVWTQNPPSMAAESVLYAASPAGRVASRPAMPVFWPPASRRSPRGLSQPKGSPVPLYESVFIARNDLTQVQVEAIADQVASIAEEAGGSVKKREYWGLRGLAYRVKKNRKAHYMLLGIECTGAAEKEIARQFGLNEDVLRHMTLRVEAIDPETPSAILAKRADDRERDRGFRGPRPAGRFGSGRGRERDDREEFRARGRDDSEDGLPDYRGRGVEE